jgi:hypothetical protein
VTLGDGVLVAGVEPSVGAGVAGADAVGVGVGSCGSGAPGPAVKYAIWAPTAASTITPPTTAATMLSRERRFSCRARKSCRAW